jgi:hypothetical protein
MARKSRHIARRGALPAPRARASTPPARKLISFERKCRSRSKSWAQGQGQSSGEDCEVRACSVPQGKERGRDVQGEGGAHLPVVDAEAELDVMCIQGLFRPPGTGFPCVRGKLGGAGRAPSGLERSPSVCRYGMSGSAWASSRERLQRRVQSPNRSPA